MGNAREKIILIKQLVDTWTMEDVIKISDEHKLEVVTESFPLEQANEVLVKLKNSEIDARAVLIP